jgi:succinate dehydrogenase hydrophobic anchor subunit
VATYHQQNGIYDTLADYHADKSRRLGWGVVMGIACQFYVVFRFKAKNQKENK